MAALFTMSQQDEAALCADSLTTGFGAGTVALQLALAQLLTAAYSDPLTPAPAAPFMPSPLHKWPNLNEDAASGRRTIDISGIMTTYIPAHWATRPTALIVQLGEPDVVSIAASGMTIGQTHTATLAILAAFNTQLGIPPSKMCWLGPWQNNGQAAQTLADVIGQLRTDVTAFGGYYIDLNASGVPPTTGVGGNSTDGIHLTAIGAPKVAAYAVSQMTFTS